MADAIKKYKAAKNATKDVKVNATLDPWITYQDNAEQQNTPCDNLPTTINLTDALRYLKYDYTSEGDIKGIAPDQLRKMYFAIIVKSGGGRGRE